MDTAIIEVLGMAPDTRGNRRQPGGFVVLSTSLLWLRSHSQACDKSIKEERPALHQGVQSIFNPGNERASLDRIRNGLYLSRRKD